MVCERRPARRPDDREHSYAAFVFHPEGHDIDAVCQQPAE